MVLFSTIDPIYYAVSWTVVHSIWQVLFWALVGGMTINLWHSKGASFRFNVLLSTVGLMIMTSMVTFIYFYSISTSVSDPEGTIMPPSPTMHRETNEAIAAYYQNASLWESLVQWISSNVYGIFLVWMIGMIMALLRLISNVSYIFYLKSTFNFPVDEFWENALTKMAHQLKVNKTIRILESALVRAPIVIGHFKPVILFPIGAINRLEVTEVESIIAHELAHIRRNDYFINIFINVAEALFYFHPAMWWVKHQLTIEREHCCDDMALETIANPIGYAKSLVAVQEMAFYSPSLAMAFAGNNKKSQLAIRINRLLTKPHRVAHQFEKSVAIFLVTAMIVAFSIAAKPSSNEGQPDCLAQEINRNKGNAHFLKFDNMTVLDSLYVPFEVNDGAFNYDDRLHHVEMVVADRHVVSFNLNGLEIVGSDISKFENLIFEILKGKDIEHSENTDDNEWSDKLINLALKNQLLEKGKKNTITLDVQKMIVNGKKLENSIHESYLQFMAENGHALDGFTQFNVSACVNPDGEVILISNHDSPLPTATKDSFGAGTSSGINADADTSTIKDPSGDSTGEYTDKPFDLWLEQQLLEDGYIKNKNQFSYIWNREKMLVDGMQVSLADRQKYAAKRRAMTGMDMSKDFLITRYKTPD